MEDIARVALKGVRARIMRGTLIALVLAMAVPALAAAQDRFVYVSNQGGANNISALRINANGTLTAVSGSPFSSGGTLTEGLTMTPDARHLYVANFTTNNVSAFNITATGGLSAVMGSPFSTGYSTPLGVAPDPDNGHLFAWNHGSAIAVSTISGTGSLTNITGSPFPVPAGQSNPFAGSVAPDGDHLYVPNENAVAATKTLTAYSVAANGAVAELQTVDTGGINPFGSAITPDGAHVYVSNPDVANNVGNVGGFNVNANGTLTAAPGSPFSVGTGSHPLNMAVSPDGQHLYVATRQTDTVNAYTINANGSLSAIPGSPFATGGDNGKGIALTPDGARLYVSNNISNNISGFNVNQSTGALTLIPGSPWPTGSAGTPDLESIAITPNQPPIAAFSPTTLAPAGQASTFSAAAASDSDGGTITRYDWDFGDGSALSDGGPTPQHVFNQPGTYTVRLTVTDNENCSTERIFTGKAMLCNGNAGATIDQQVTIQQAQQPAQQCVVPDVVKKKKKKAKQAIVAANCSVGTIKKKFSSKVKKKKVIKQKPAAGTTLPAGSPVNLKVSKGEKKD